MAAATSDDNARTNYETADGVDCWRNPTPMKKLPALIAFVLLGAAVTVQAADAKANWSKYCAKCHGIDAKANTKLGKKLKMRDYTDPKIQANFTDEQALTAIKVGLTDKDGNMRMDVAEGLKEDEMKALVAYIRTFKR